MITYTGTEASSGIRIYGRTGFTYILRNANTAFLKLSIQTQTGTYVELTGFTPGQTAKIEVRDDQNALMEITSISNVQVGNKYAYTLPVLYYPLTNQTYLQNETVEVKVKALQTDTVTATIGGVSVSLSFNSETALWEGSLSAGDFSGQIVVSVIVNGTSTSKNIYVYQSAKASLKPAFQMLTWLQSIAGTATNGKRVKERYMVNTQTWGSPGYGGGGLADIWYRPDCNIETMLALFHAWRETGNSSFYNLARDIWNSIKLLQEAAGGWAFYQNGVGGIDWNHWMDDNSEVSQSLILIAEIDTDNSSEYIQSAVKTMDHLQPSQRADGAYPSIIPTATAAYICAYHSQVITALCYVYPYTTRKAEYKTAIENGLNWIITRYLRSDGRIKHEYEITGSPNWIEPVGDQVRAIRALTAAEKFVTDSTQKALWTEKRRLMVSWLDTKIHSTGAVLNGVGHGIYPSDYQYDIDHIYITRFATECYLLCYELDDNMQYLNTANKICSFLISNIHTSDSWEMNGVLRGAYNLRDGNWDVNDIYNWGQAGEEFGSNPIYSGWTQAPNVTGIFTTAKSLLGDFYTSGSPVLMGGFLLGASTLPLSVQMGTTNILKVINENLNLSEVFSRLRGVVKTVTDSLSLNEALSRTLGKVRVIDESINMAEARPRIKGILKVISRGIGISESTVRKKGIAKTISEIMGITESMSHDADLSTIIPYKFQENSITSGDLTENEISSSAFASRDAYTKVLLHMDDLDGPTTFIDEIGKAWTAYGNAQIDTALKKFGTGSCLLDGTGDYLSVADSADFDFGTGNFTVDFWGYDLAAAVAGTVAQLAAGALGATIGRPTAGNLLIYLSSDGATWDIANGQSMGAVPGANWVHYALVRSGNNFYTFRNGVQVSTWTSLASIYMPVGDLHIGQYTNTGGTGGFYLSGHIDEFRISKGIARWTANFTPPTRQYELPVNEQSGSFTERGTLN